MTLKPVRSRAFESFEDEQQSYNSGTTRNTLDFFDKYPTAKSEPK